MRKESFIKKLNREREKSVYGTQAQRIISKFGGITKLREALLEAGLDISYQAVWSWNRPPEKNGQDGLIPPRPMKHILKAALIRGIHLTSKDLDPRETIDPSKLMDVDEETNVEVIKEKSMEYNRPKKSKYTSPTSQEIELTKIY